MENKGIINCPNCNQRIFADSKQCPSCKYSLEKKENNFDKAQYDFLYYTYEKNRDKQATIKLGMEKFNMSMQEIKKMVDYAAEEIYNEEEAEKRAIPKEELPTNGVDYSKIKYGKSFLFGTTIRKISPMKIIGIILYFIIILILLTKAEVESMQKGLFVAFLGGIFTLSIMIINHKNVPDSPHTFVFSFSQYFIHRLIYQIAIMFLVIWLPLQFENSIIAMENANKTIFILVYGVGIITLFLIFFYQFGKNTNSEFTVEFGAIRYSYERLAPGGIQEWHNDTSRDADRHRMKNLSWVHYDINSIKNVKETFNSIIIYGDIEKKIVKTIGIQTKGKVDRLKVTKSFKNNKNLIKSLKLCIKEK